MQNENNDCTINDINTFLENDELLHDIGDMTDVWTLDQTCIQSESPENWETVDDVLSFHEVLCMKVNKLTRLGQNYESSEKRYNDTRICIEIPLSF